MENSKIDIYVGTVKENATDELYKISGMELVLVSVSSKDNEFMIVNPLTLEDLEKYYSVAFEIMGREWISEDFKTFLEYMLDKDCEIINSTSKDNFLNLRNITEEDENKFIQNLNKFKQKYKINIEN